MCEGQVSALPGHEEDPQAFIRRRKHLWLLVAAFLAVSVYNNVHNGLWLDEAYSLNTSQRGLADVLRQALHFELQPPVYFVLLHWWLALCSSLVCARLLSTACAAGVLFGLDALAPLLGPNHPRLFLALLGALSPMLLWAGSTARGYALTALIATASLVFYLRMWGDKRPGSRRDLILLLVSWCVGVFNFYFFGFLIAGQVVGAFFSGKARGALAL
jgi:mannosyltransferase